MNSKNGSHVLGKILIAGIKTLGVCAGAFIILGIINSFNANKTESPKKLEARRNN